MPWTSLAVQWLGLLASRTGSPGQGTKILHATGPGAFPSQIRFHIKNVAFQSRFPASLENLENLERGVLILNWQKSASAKLTFCCCCLVAKSCPTLWDPMDCSTPGFPVLHYLPEFAQTHVHWVCDAMQPSQPLPPPSPPAFNLSQP